MHKIISNSVCMVCENKTSSKWMLGKSLLDVLGSLREDSEILPNDWICGGCFNSAIYLNNIGHTTHKLASARDGASDYTLKILEEDGACLAKRVMDKYKALITSIHDVHDIADIEITNYKKNTENDY